uniref:pentatricopeptide repeat-containing protein 1, mitochondrial n=1 Tax=Ciona intestinalis TaxID=7719 RepID=UPI000180B3AD|nr:pentatricopeptide repeat-containing protein 1, mitochondrial [Ciona intestinalis]|eukprot:XP_002123758.3 pentatricopeptide repeat-containing protein 1, mitochondrial [Ciona intestinalis]
MTQTYTNIKRKQLNSDFGFRIVYCESATKVIVGIIMYTLCSMFRRSIPLMGKEGPVQLLLSKIVLSPSFTLGKNDFPKNVNLDQPDMELGNSKESFGLIAKAQDFRVFKHRHGNIALEVIEDEHIPVTNKWKNTPRWYFYQCKQLASQGKVDECLSILETTMLKIDKVPPQEYNFSVVIGLLGRHGRVKKAFELYSKLKSYGLTASMACLTSLFNAVSNSHDSADMFYLKKLHLKLKESDVRLNRITCNALLMAYARHTTFKETTEIFQNCIRNGVKPDALTFSALMTSCLKHKEEGFYLALQVWRSMLSIEITPTGQNITTMLNVAQHCGIGDANMASKFLLGNLPNSTQKKVGPFETLQQQKYSCEKFNLPNKGLKAFTAEYEDSDKNLPVRLKPVIPNLLDTEQCNLETVTSLTKCTEPYKRLDLMGGYEGIINVLKQHKISLSIQVLTLLVKLVKPSYPEEEKVLQIAEDSSVKLDVDFYNTLIHKQAARGDHQLAVKTFNRIKEQKLQPNYRSYCVHAISCNTFKLGSTLFQDMEKTDMKITSVLLHTLIAACIRRKVHMISGYKGLRYPDFYYLTYLVKQLTTHDINASATFISLLEKVTFYPEEYNRWKHQDEVYEKRLNIYRKAYNQWLRNADVQSIDAL